MTFRFVSLDLKGGVNMNTDKFVNDNWHEYSTDLENLFKSLSVTKHLNKTDKFLIEEFMKTNSKIQLSLVSKFLDERSK